MCIRDSIYREYCKVYQRTSRAAKSEFYEKKLERYANNVKETWKILRAAIGHNKKGGHNFPSYFYDKVSPRVPTAHSGGGPGVGDDDECASAHPSSLPPPEPSAQRVKVTDKQLIAEGFKLNHSTHIFPQLGQIWHQKLNKRMGWNLITKVM